MIITIITIIFLSTLFIYGWSYCTTYTPIGLKDVGKDIENFNPFGEGATNKEIAWWFRFYIGNFIHNKMPVLKPLLKPLFMCEVCMSSIYGSLIYWLVMLLTAKISVGIFIFWPFTIVMIAGSNRIIKSIMQK